MTTWASGRMVQHESERWLRAAVPHPAPARLHESAADTAQPGRPAGALGAVARALGLALMVLAAGDRDLAVAAALGAE